MAFTQEQETMKVLLKEHCDQIGMSLVQLLALHRRVGEPIGELIERVYASTEELDATK